ncbi:hypothetical protein AB1285_19800 [Microbacterium sp. NRRL B-14842]|uniref:hypothetical protein n=1 Tax=Microbacterium sp. NRRL B-14842 TaxID=3162881 RepID=UPI003D2DF6F1
MTGSAAVDLSGDDLGYPVIRGGDGQQRATTALTVFGVVFAIVVLLFSLILFADPAPAMKALGIGVLAAVAVGVWLMVAHARVSRVRVVRPVVDGPAIAFGGAAGIVWPLRALAPVGALLSRRGHGASSRCPRTDCRSSPCSSSRWSR